MLVEAELAQISPKKDMMLTIGVFDGVHIGHKHLLSQLREQAEAQNLLSGVVTFRQHPEDVLLPRARLSFLTDLTQRIKLIKDEGVESVIVLTFDSELARLGARQYVSLLKRYLRMRGLVIGPDFALGQNREGNTGALGRLGQEMGFSVTVVPPVMINGEVVSSTAIRKALAVGDVKKAHTLTGRYFSLSASVVIGAGRGKKLDFPTANLDVEPERALPADGVYASWAYIGGKSYQSVTNIGKDPTFGENKRTVEVHILDYEGNLYGCRLKVELVERIRDERKFNAVRELTEQMAEDVKQGRAILDFLSRN